MTVLKKIGQDIAGQMPAVPGLLDGLKGENTPCVILATYGNRHYDETLAQVKRILGEQGFRCAGAAAVITPRHFCPYLGGGSPGREGHHRSGAVCPGCEGEAGGRELGGSRRARQPQSSAQARCAGEEGPGLGHLPGLRHLRQGLPHRGHGPEDPYVGGR